MSFDPPASYYEPLMERDGMAVLDQYARLEWRVEVQNVVDVLGELKEAVESLEAGADGFDILSFDSRDIERMIAEVKMLGKLN